MGWFLLILIAASIILFLQYAGSDDGVIEIIEEAENEPNRSKRLEILRTADINLGYDHPDLLLDLSQAIMAVAYEKTDWEERLKLARQARQISVRAMNAQIQKGWMTPSAKDLLYLLRSVHKAAEQCEEEAIRHLGKSE